ncbi:MAG: DUF5711 family protein [Clostridia bacterium]
MKKKTNIKISINKDLMVTSSHRKRRSGAIAPKEENTFKENETNRDTNKKSNISIKRKLVDKAVRQKEKSVTGVDEQLQDIVEQLNEKSYESHIDNNCDKTRKTNVEPLDTKKESNNLNKKHIDLDIVKKRKDSKEGQITNNQEALGKEGKQDNKERSKVEIQNKMPKEDMKTLKSRSEKRERKNIPDEGIEILNKYKKSIKQKRDMLKGKTYKEVEEELEYKAEKSKKRIPIIICTLFIFVVILLYVFFTYGPIIGISINKASGISNDKKIDIATTEEDIYKMYDKDLLVYSNQIIRTYNRNGKKNWEYKLSQQFTPSIYIKDSYMVVSNNANGTIYLFQNKKEILNKKIDGIIQHVFLDNNGNFAIEYSTTGYKKIIGVYSKNGQNLYNTYLSGNAIINIEMLNEGKKLVIAQVDSSSFKVGTSISMIDGTKQTDNIKEIVKLDNNLLYDLTIQGQNIIMLLDNKITSCDINSGKLSDIKNFQSTQMLFVSIFENYYTYVEKVLSEQKDKYKIQMSRFDNSQIGSQEIENLPKIMKNSGILTYLLYPNNLQVINKWGVEIKNIHLDAPPKDIIIFEDERSVGLIYTNKIYIINI